MGKLAHFLQEHIMGEVLDGVDARSHFSRDASIFQIEPALVVYPRNEQDVRKIARFTWGMAERGKVLPITSRGAGSDFSGGSIGEGMVMVFPAHMNRILGMDLKKGIVNVEPGANIAKIQQTLNVHYYFLPSVPASAEYSTIGGSVANNSGGAYSQKYGLMENSVNGLRVVLANGEVIRTERLSKRELSKKLGLANFEGQIYRELDALISENYNLIMADPSLGNSGYALHKIKDKDGSFDLTPLFVGSQGTLGIVSEIELKSEPFNPQPTTLLAEVDSMELLIALTSDLANLNPAALEMVDAGTLKHIKRLAPSALKNVFTRIPEFALIVQFDDSNARVCKRKLKQAMKVCNKQGINYQTAEDDESRERLWKVKSSLGYILTDANSKSRPLPTIEGAIVPIRKMPELYAATQNLFAKYRIPFMSWGHIGMGQLSLMPKIDLSETSGRQQVFRLMDEYYKMVINFGGSISGVHNDGRLRGQYQRFELGPDLYALMQQTKLIFDPYGTLNPGVKVNVDRAPLIKALRLSYSLEHHYAHLPRV